MTDTEIRLLNSFPKSFVNEYGEFIAHGKANEYFILKGCACDLDIKCKVLEWLSRAAYKTEPYKSRKSNEAFHDFMLSGINKFLGTKFTQEEMRGIYTKLGNCANHNKTIVFIESGYDFAVLGKDRNQQKEVKGCSGECDFCLEADGCEQCGSV